MQITNRTRDIDDRKHGVTPNAASTAQYDIDERRVARRSAAGQAAQVMPTDLSRRTGKRRKPTLCANVTPPPGWP